MPHALSVQEGIDGCPGIFRDMNKQRARAVDFGDPGLSLASKGKAQSQIAGSFMNVAEQLNAA
ncbi:hypothetical protein AA101099_2215 [Neoasaia chiangmaiensis NBRC 101099]|nr:hypothetical protein AA101099_2215 [Neoasaia chiangmaiensis NBRC 101099]